VLLGSSRNQRVAQFHTVALAIRVEKISSAPTGIGIYRYADQCAK
jgi:hypothetical protein